MCAAPDVAEEILALKARRRAIILAHHYQDPEIQELADLVGDNLELARAARRFEGQVIAFCGVRFMAETAKALNPEKIVVIPDPNAGCSLADSCPVEAVRAFKKRHPDHAIVSYINTSIEVKAESDIVCTSRNAVAVVNSIPPRKPILFVPDINLGNYVQRQTGRKNMQIWQGACIVHATFSARRLSAALMDHPGALIAAHPECPAQVLRMAHFTGSPSQIVEWCVRQPSREFILMAESGIRYSLEKLAPGKKFYFVANENCNCSECPYMRLNSLEKLRACLEDLAPQVDPAVDLLRRALIPIERMLMVA